MAPQPPPEARLIARKRAEQIPRLSRLAAARRAGMSETRWRQLEKGTIRVRGVNYTETAPDDTLARMAYVVGVTPEELTGAGRPDAAGLLARLLDAAPGDPALPEVRALADRIAAERRLSNGQKQAITDSILRAISNDGA